MRKIVGADCVLLIDDQGWVKLRWESKERTIGQIYNGIFEFCRSVDGYMRNTQGWALTKELVDHSKSLGIEVFFLNPGIIFGSERIVKGLIARKRLKKLIKLGEIEEKKSDKFEWQYHIPVFRWRTKGPLYNKYVKLLKK